MSDRHDFTPVQDEGARDPTKGTLGRRGERVAAAALEREGWRVLARNYRASREEIDLVVERAGVLAFVEVKTRSGVSETGLEAIDARKRTRIRRVAAAWLREHPFRGHTIRFDAVRVRIDPRGGDEVEHHPDAWR